MGMSSFGHRILAERDWLADRVSEWYHDQSVVTDRSFGTADDSAEFVYSVPVSEGEPRRYEVRVREVGA